MKPDAALLKDILASVANVDYQSYAVNVDELQFEEDVPKNKLQYHVKHLIKEGYLEGQIIGLERAGSVILIERMTDKGALVLDTAENPAFLDWVKENTGSAFGDLMKGMAKGTASLGWALLKQWLATQGVSLPGV